MDDDDARKACLSPIQPHCMRIGGGGGDGGDGGGDGGGSGGGSGAGDGGGTGGWGGLISVVMIVVKDATLCTVTLPVGKNALCD